jgi:hypothetical protein
LWPVDGVRAAARPQEEHSVEPGVESLHTTRPAAIAP